ncbi:unnamed protein product, partial [Oppiella nova]
LTQFSNKGRGEYFCTNWGTSCPVSKLCNNNRVYNMPGYKVSRFPNLSVKEKSQYTCSLCEDILNCPMTTPCCLKTFCEDCITKLSTKQHYLSL